MKFFQIISRDVKYDFIGYRNVFITFSSLALVASLILIFTRGLNFGIDFAGGTEIQIAFNVCKVKKEGEKDKKVSSIFSIIREAQAGSGTTQPATKSSGQKAATTQPTAKTAGQKAVTTQPTAKTAKTAKTDAQSTKEKKSTAKTAGTSAKGCIPPEEIDIKKLRKLMKELFPKSTPVIQPMGTGGDEFILKFKEVSLLTKSRLNTIQKRLEKLFENPKMPNKTDLVNFRFRSESGDKIDLVFHRELTGFREIKKGDKTSTTKKSGQRNEKELIVKLFTEMGLKDVKVIYSGHSGEGYEYTVSFAGLAGELLQKLRNIFGEGNVKILQVESVGPKVGKKLRNDGIVSIILANFFILIYIAIRFDFRYAPGAVAALIHDVTITTGLFSALQLPFDLTTIAALLTIVGYSLNDTIVVYDRIRENWQKSRVNFGAVINRSINETLSRTLLTSLTTLVAIIPIYIIGGANIKWFAFAMIFGILIGTYSSIGIATPIVYWLDKYFQRHEIAADAEKEAIRERRRRRRLEKK